MRCSVCLVTVGEGCEFDSDESFEGCEFDSDESFEGCEPDSMRFEPTLFWDGRNMPKLAQVRDMGELDPHSGSKINIVKFFFLGPYPRPA